MDEQRDAAARQNRHRLAQLRFADVLKFVDTRRHEEALEPAHAGIDERLELRGVTGHDAAPERHVHVTASARRRSLLVQRRDGRRRGHAVERHVDDRRHAAGCRGARRGVEALPFGAAGFVDVHVRVDQTRQDDEIARIEEVAAIRAIVVDACDDAVLDVDGCGTDAICKNDAGAPDYHRRISFVLSVSGSTRCRVARRISRRR